MIIPDGTLRTIAATGLPVVGGNGTVISALRTFADVTERKRASERTRSLAEASEAVSASRDAS